MKMREIRQVYLQQLGHNSKRWIAKVGIAYSLAIAIVALWQRVFSKEKDN